MASHQEQRAPVATSLASSSPASVPCSLNPADYQWGTPSNAVLCQQFFQLQLLYNNPFAFPGQAPAAMLQFPFPGAAPPAAGAPQAAAQRPPFSFPACAFPPLPFAAGFLPGGFMACAGMQQPQQPAAVQAPAPKPADAPAHAKATQSAAAPAVNSSVPPKANSKAKASRATKPAKVAPSTPAPTQAEAFDLSADEFSKLLEDSFLPDLDASACRSGLPASTSASELSEQPAAAGSPRDSCCKKHFADPFSAAMDDALPMDFDAFELDLDLLGPCDGPAPPAAPAQQLASVATAPPKKLASGDLNNMQLGRAASVGGSPRAKAKASTAKATVAGPAGGVQKVSGAAKAASSGKATAHASKAAVAATVQDAPYANDLLSFDDARLDGGLTWDLDLPDTIDFENPFSTPVTVC